MIGSVLASQLQQICSVLELKLGPVCVRTFLSFNTSYIRPLSAIPARPKHLSWSRRGCAFPPGLGVLGSRRGGYTYNPPSSHRVQVGFPPWKVGYGRAAQTRAGNHGSAQRGCSPQPYQYLREHSRGRKPRAKGGKTPEHPDAQWTQRARGQCHPGHGLSPTWDTPSPAGLPQNTPSSGPGRLWFSFVPWSILGSAPGQAGKGAEAWQGQGVARRKLEEAGSVQYKELFWAVPGECGRGRAEVTDGRNIY